MAPGITLFFLLSYGILFFYYRKGWQKTVDYVSERPENPLKISVVIAARNEAENIPRLLDSLLSQTYSSENFEVVIVDDHSTDNTFQLISQQQHSNIRVLPLEASMGGKKKAIEFAISQTTGALIVATDADCQLPPSWLETIAAFCVDNQSLFIAAPVKFNYRDRLIERFQALDFMMLQGITASGIALNLHYMCNGANLAYSRKAFEDVNGFEGIDRIASGDDMLLMHKIRKNHPLKIHYLKNENAIVKTQPMPSWKSFLMQRRRWASKNLMYDDIKIKFILIFAYVFNLWFFVLAVSGLFSPIHFFYAFIFMLVKACIEFWFLKDVAKFYKEEELLKYLFLYQPLHLIYTIFTGLWSQFGNYEWKGRSTK